MDGAGSGIIQHAVQALFAELRQREEQAVARAAADGSGTGPTYAWSLSVTFLELYNEELIDLLRSVPSSSSTVGASLALREDGSGNIVLAGARAIPVATYDELMACLAQGTLCRSVGSTNMNAMSSRSHAVFSLNLEQVISPAPRTTTRLRSKYHFVDLAGSERLKRTGAVGARKKESIAINQGLLALGNCISALASAASATQPPRKHIPYRDSKLTRLLQDSLGGNSLTLMIACVSPCDFNYAETHSTLVYAQRTRAIKNHVRLMQ
ncbi:P-loop containing nucleoside triphosphate hydrolase protein, partial [Caulochytrium protostelioides]